MEEFEESIRSLSLKIQTTSSDGVTLFETKHEINNEMETDQLIAAEEAVFGIKKGIENPCPKDLSFSDFRKGLRKVGEGVYKRVLKEGREKIDLEHSKVFYDFALFLEGSVDAFDSSVSVNVSEGVLPGIVDALSTMKNNESAVFWISSELMYGKIGIFQRVPPSADFLLQIKVAGVELKEGPVDQKEKIRNPYQQLLKTTLNDYKEAYQIFKLGNYKRCIATYLKLANKLERSKIPENEDESLQKKLLIKIYQNLCICYNKANRPEQCCLMIRQLEQLTPINGNPKALFAKGKAKLMLLDYGNARQCFMMAASLLPGDATIEAAIHELDKLQQQSRVSDEESAELLKKFTDQAAERKQKHMSEATERKQKQMMLEAKVLASKDDLEELVREFMDGDLQRLSLPTCGAEYLKLAEEIASRYPGIHVKGFEAGGQIYYYFSKSD